MPIPSPNINARSYALVDQLTGKVLAENNAHERVEPASITKVMTVYVAGQALASGLISLDDEVVVSEKAWKMEGSRMFIEVGTRVTVDQLLDGIIVQSGNDASVALAEHVAGTEEIFASQMNEQARKLGMKDSSFANATGLPDPGTYTTAYDLTLLARALVRDFPELYQRFSHKEFTYNEIHQPNRNRLLYRDPSVDGIKTGHTSSAGYCLLSSAQRDGMRLIAAVMGTDSDTARTEASQALINYGYRFYETRELYPAGAVVTQPRVWGGASENVRAGVLRAVNLVVPRGRYEDMKATARIDEPLKAPLAQGQPVGAIVLTLDDKTIEEVPLQALDAVDEGSLFSRLYDEFMLLFE
ncbi:MAG: D-alanyl-D-alanine carboxypeptidase [Gammaproteobacteria bacterium]|nr:D-alanyl-D-alanine carboxypeptidase [Gammaproteobacteria bacterium]MCP5199224.1 D-alanyl-D-alanine carboxypeptidase [Gammaproteobacteria bacterium]